MKKEELSKLDKDELIKKIEEQQDRLKLFEQAYKIVPDGVYYLHRFVYGENKVFYKIALPKDINAPLTETFYPNFNLTPYKMIYMGKENNNLPDKCKIRIKSFKEETYKKGYSWIYGIRVLDFEVLPQESEDRIIKEFNSNGLISEEDDLLF